MICPGKYANTSTHDHTFLSLEFNTGLIRKEEKKNAKAIIVNKISVCMYTQRIGFFFFLFAFFSFNGLRKKIVY